MDVRDWKDSAKDWFQSGHATDEHWEEMAEVLLSRSENDGLGSGLDHDILNHACYRGATLNQFGDSVGKGGA